MVSSSIHLYAQVGIGTTTPNAFFNVADGKDVLFGQDVSGSGTKLLWISSQSAFRAGTVTGTQWDISNIGTRSTGIGFNAIANGANSTAIGFNVIANAYNATALGNNVSTNSKHGAIIIGDDGGYDYYSSAFDQLMMRFGGGYMLYTENGEQSTAVGVKLAAHGNAWLTISDSTRKENVRKADGQYFLQKISQMRLGSWNYKGQDPRQHRHYGPMAQDFFAAFGHDALGTIGEDKSINQADFDGVNLIAIQALIKKVETLEADNKKLKLENADLKNALTTDHQQDQLIQARLDKIEALLHQQPTAQTITANP